MRSFLAMVKANMKMTLRNRAALFWNLIFPLIFIVIFGSVIGGEDSLTIDVAITGDDSEFRQSGVQAMEGDDVFAVTMGLRGEELDALADGDRDIVLEFNGGSDGVMPQVLQYYDNTQGPNARISISVVNQLLLREAQGDNPVEINTIGIAGADIDYIDFLVPGILAMAIMNAGVIGLSTSFVSYRERGILRRIKVTPFPIASFVGARIVSQLVVAVLQALVLIGAASLLFDFDIRGSPIVVLIAILFGALAFLAIGFAISSFAPNVEAAATYANAIAFPMLFLSGVFFEIDAGPAWLQAVSKVLPLRYLVDALREPMTRGAGLDEIWPDLLVLAATFVIGMVIAVRFFRWESRAS